VEKGAYPPPSLLSPANQRERLASKTLEKKRMSEGLSKKEKRKDCEQSELFKFAGSEATEEKNF
jgi:hypothetical protein